MNEKNCYIPVDLLQNFMKDVFLSSGASNEDALICSEILITSDKRGIESHGIGRLKMYFDKIKNRQINPKASIEIIRETPTTAVVDGHDGLGMVIAKKSMEMAIKKAREYGMGSVAVRNSSHFGIDGYYPLMAVKEGMIGMSFTNARPAIAPTFGVQPMLGTNPISFGAPTDEAFPFLFDGATSITQRGKIEVAERLGKQITEGWVIDHNGQPMTDPKTILPGLVDRQAALLPLGGDGELFAGYKGYNLATIVEILSSALQTGKFMYGLTGLGENGESVPNRIGHFFLALNIEAFLPLDEFCKTTGNILRELRNAEKAPNQPRIFTAGEKEYENEQRIMRQGVPIVPDLQHEILKIKNELGLMQYTFPFE